MADIKNRTGYPHSNPIDISSASTYRKKATKQEDIFSDSDLELRELQKRYDILNQPIDALFKVMTEYIKGQDEAIKDLLFLVYNNHYLNMLEDTTDIDVKRLSGIAIGPSGSGKSAAISRIAKLFNVPFVRYNATSLTSAGYVGGDVDSIILTLIKNAGGDVQKAMRGIIFIDEIDKKVSSSPNNSSNRDINGTSVQEEFLKIFEPNTIYVGKDNTPFDTHMLTVICGGRFKELDKIREERLNGKKQIGFNSTRKPSEDDEDFNIIDEKLSPNYIPEDLIKFGFIDELVGRFSVIAEFKKLSAETLEDIIYAKNSILQQYLNVFYSRGVDLIVNPIVFAQLAQAIADSDTGARDIERKIIQILRPALYDTEQNYCPGICEIDEDLNYTSIFQQRKSGALQLNIVKDFANRTDLKSNKG